jgi:hypothetical protein
MKHVVMFSGGIGSWAAGWASIADLKASGLSHLLGTMELEHLHHAIPSGTA